MKSRFLSAVLVPALLTLVPVTGATAASDDAPGPQPTNVPYVVEPLPHLENVPAPTAQATPAPTKGAAAGLAIPALHSRASSTHTVFLDFDGVNLPASSQWTKGTGAIAPGPYRGYSLDGSTDFNQTEIDAITKIWRIVAEKYSTFDVNVTTVDPGQAALTRTDENDNGYGVQVVLTSDTSDTSPKKQVCNNTCAGVAWSDLFDGRQQNTSGGGMTVFDSSAYTIAWVFPSAVSGSTATAAAHEVGHTLGLDHDGGSVDPNYYGGHGNWVPIMGISTNARAVSQFSEGEYTGATNAEDDLAIISTNGFAGTNASFTRADDYTTSSGAPTGAAVLGNQASYSKAGVISNAADDDVFSISRDCTDPIVATATGIGAGQSVDLRVDIQDSVGNLLVSNDPASGQQWVDASSAYEPTGMNATATLPSPSAGGTTYRVKVDGVGSGNPFDTGYSDYGSIGPYTLTISGCPGGATAPGAPASATAKSAANGRGATITWTAPTNNGGGAITGYTVAGLPGGTRTLGNMLAFSATGLTPARTYQVVVRAVNFVGSGASRSVTLKTFGVPSAPRIGTPSSGKAGGTKNATARWAAPTSTGGSAIKSYKVVAYKIVGGKITKTYVSKVLSASARSFAFALPGGSYKFKVVAYNAVGASPGSAYSKVVTSR